MSEAAQLSEHRNFLNAYYGISRHFYDLSRKYYLLGRDPMLQTLATESWRTLVEIGPGTGRNLHQLHKLRPESRLFGIEASDEMVRHAQEKCPFAEIFHGFAETCQIQDLLKTKPDRILFSYCLSMVQNPERAIENAIQSLAPGGEVVVVDFGEADGLPRWFQSGLQRWLAMFHVHPPQMRDYMRWGGSCSTSATGYVLSSRFSARTLRENSNASQ